MAASPSDAGVTMKNQKTGKPMKSVSLKIDDEIFGETERIRSVIKKPRNRYINEAIEYYNRIHKRRILKEKLEKESELVKEDSMHVLKEFEDIDYGS